MGELVYGFDGLGIDRFRELVCGLRSNGRLLAGTQCFQIATDGLQRFPHLGVSTDRLLELGLELVHRTVQCVLPVVGTRHGTAADWPDARTPPQATPQANATTTKIFNLEIAMV